LFPAGEEGKIKNKKLNKSPKGAAMSEVEAIEARIRNLPPSDFASLRTWFYEFENTCWDQQIASDFKAGKLNKLIEKAWTEYTQGKACEL
jgi:hypothetical protein